MSKSGKLEEGRKRMKVRHFKWSPAEDLLLKKLIIGRRIPNWAAIAKRFTNRNARQCKDRWNYYLCPTVNNGEWTPEEDALLFEKYKEYGTKWSKIAKFFNNRTNTNVKNRYLAIMRNEARTKAQEKLKNQSEKTSDMYDEEEEVNDEKLQSLQSSDSISSPEQTSNELFDNLFNSIPFDLVSTGLALDQENSQTLLETFNFIW